MRFGTLVTLCYAFVSLTLAAPASTAAATSAADLEARWSAFRAAATDHQLYTLLYALPKGGDLHHHASGSNRSEWMWAILTDPTRNGGVTYYTRARFTSPADAIAPSVRFHTVSRHTYDHLPAATRAEYVALTDLTPVEREDWHNAFRLDAPGEGRAEFFGTHWQRMGDINRNPHVRFELLADNLKAYAAENVAYLESMFGVSGCILPDGTALTRDEALVLLRARLAAPDVADLPITVRFLGIVLRFHPRAEAQLAEEYGWIDAHRDLWVGLNLAGIEENNRGHPTRFTTAFRDLRRRYPTLPLAIHAGEMDAPDDHVRQTLLLGATRIGHGLNLLGDPGTLLLLQHSGRVLIETNLISNQLLDYTSDLTRHPFPEFLRTGIPTNLNTDDRGMWDSNLTDEYYTAVTAFNLSWAELVALGRHSLAFAFCDEVTKSRLLADYSARVAAFETAYLAVPPAAALARLATEVRPVTYGYARRNWSIAFSDQTTP